MPKPRSKRQAIRDERKRKRQTRALADEAADQAKRRRRHGDQNDEPAAPVAEGEAEAGRGLPDPAFFGMLSGDEQEYFRSIDEQLEADRFSSHEERDAFLTNVLVEAEGKELKLACSQSCSRLLERLILMANTRHKKKLFQKFADNFLHLIQHRFASHCCETLFLQSAPVVTRELGGERDDAPAEGEAEEDPLPLMEDLFLLTLDELDGYLGFFLTHKFASHALRVLLIILSGRPLELSSTNSLVRSRKKERIAAPWKSDDMLQELNAQPRAVPTSFTLAAKKIIADATSGMDNTALRVMAAHPTGNPVLQLMLEVDLSLGSEIKESSLLWRLVPDAPTSLKEATSVASHFVNPMLYSPIGSRLLETMITDCPGRVFKSLYRNAFANRIQSLVRNDVSCYPAMRVLSRLSREDLVESVEKILPSIEKLVSLSRFNVIKTLFERCWAREASPDIIQQLLKALTDACGTTHHGLIPKLCFPEPEARDPGYPRPDPRNHAAAVAHGSQLAATMLGIPGPTSRAIQTSLRALSPGQLVHLATSSASTAHLLTAALTTPSDLPAFHKGLVAVLMQHTELLATSEHGSRVLSAITSVPSKGDGFSLPFHLKEAIASQLSQDESVLRETFAGRCVWRAWRGDLWTHRRSDWIAWAREVDGPGKDPVWKKVNRAPGGAGEKTKGELRGGEKKKKDGKKKDGTKTRGGAAVGVTVQ